MINYTVLTFLVSNAINAILLKLFRRQNIVSVTSHFHEISFLHHAKCHKPSQTLPLNIHPQCRVPFALCSKQKKSTKIIYNSSVFQWFSLTVNHSLPFKNLIPKCSFPSVKVNETLGAGVSLNEIHSLALSCSKFLKYTGSSRSAFRFKLLTARGN